MLKHATGSPQGSPVLPLRADQIKERGPTCRRRRAGRCYNREALATCSSHRRPPTRPVLCPENEHPLEAAGGQRCRRACSPGWEHRATQRPAPAQGPEAPTGVRVRLIQRMRCSCAGRLPPSWRTAGGEKRPGESGRTNVQVVKGKKPQTNQGHYPAIRTQSYYFILVFPFIPPVSRKHFILQMMRLPYWLPLGKG